MAKYAIIVQAGEHELARALHGLLYARELSEGGHTVRLLFDGAGTGWIAKMEDPGWKYHEAYRWVKDRGLIAGVCQYCSTAYGATQAARQGGLLLLGEASGHPSLLPLVNEGYQLLVL